jgi:hypothetical protein
MKQFNLWPLPTMAFENKTFDFHFYFKHGKVGHVQKANASKCGTNFSKFNRILKETRLVQNSNYH